MIQNATLGEFKIRDLNDEINRLMKHKHYWEIRLRELGGHDHIKKGKQHFEIEGKELPGQPGECFDSVVFVCAPSVN
jgi:pre-mRNA-splicing factor ISY1